MRIRSLDTSRLARDGLPAGAPAPRFTLATIAGDEVSIPATGAGQMSLLVFSRPDCGPCNELAPFLERLSRSARDLRVILVSNGSAEAALDKAREHGLSFTVAVHEGWSMARAYATFATPAAYLIDADGRTMTDVILGPAAIISIAERIVMLEHAQERISELRGEVSRGQIELDDVERRRRYLQETLLRMEGAIQALVELTAQAAIVAPPAVAVASIARAEHDATADDLDSPNGGPIHQHDEQR